MYFQTRWKHKIYLFESEQLWWALFSTLLELIWWFKDCGKKDVVELLIRIFGKIFQVGKLPSLRFNEGLLLEREINIPIRTTCGGWFLGNYCKIWATFHSNTWSHCPRRTFSIEKEVFLAPKKFKKTSFFTSFNFFDKNGTTLIDGGTTTSWPGKIP